MKLPFLLLLILFMACHNKENPSTTKELSINLDDKNDWLNQDETFEKSEVNIENDTTPIDTRKEIVFISDINNDGNKDTVWRTLKEGNQQLFFSCSSNPLVIAGQMPYKFINAGDLNYDNYNEIVLIEEISEGCWAELLVYSLVNEWQLKLKTITSLCAGDFYFKSENIDKRNAQFISYGYKKDSIQNNDTIEIIAPNTPVVHTLSW